MGNLIGILYEGAHTVVGPCSRRRTTVKLGRVLAALKGLPGRLNATSAVSPGLAIGHKVSGRGADEDICSRG
jgi:hypothetical protein